MGVRPLTLRLSVRGADSKALDRIVPTLQREGFDVVSAMPTGLVLAAPGDVISKFFDSKVAVSDQKAQFSTEPTYDRLPSEYSYAAYFPTKPTLF